MSVTTLRPRRGFRITGWGFLAMIVGFFAVVIGVDVSFAVLAYRTHPGEVSVTPYEDGLVYDKKIAQLRAQEALGWKAAAGAERTNTTAATPPRRARPRPARPPASVTPCGG